MTDAEIEKLYLEIKHLRFDYEVKEKNKKWSKLLTANSFLGYILALMIASFQVMNPIANYFKERSARYRFQLNSEMISLINSEKDSETRLRAATMLTYYNYNSIPILLYFMESGDEEATVDLTAKVFRKLSKIEADSSFTEITKSFGLLTKRIGNEEDARELTVFKRYLKLFQELKSSFSGEQREKICYQYEKLAAEFKLSGFNWHHTSLTSYEAEFCAP